MQNILSGQMNALLQKSLDAVWLRQKVISNNLANTDTPGFKSSTVEFEDLLKNALDGSAGQVGEVEPKVIQKTGTQTREDGNNVDVDNENIELAKAQFQYEYLVRELSMNIDRLKYVITDGRA